MPILLISLVTLAFCAGLIIENRWLRESKRLSVDQQPSREQLLAWLDQAPVGWLVLDRRDRVCFINSRAQRLLQIPASQAPPPVLSELDSASTLLDLTEYVRDHQHPMRLEWDVANQELEIFAFAGHEGSVALYLQSRRSIEAQLSQQERWVSDVAHELKTPLTALLLVGDSLAGNVTDRNAVLVERLLKELRRMQDLVGDLLELSRLENVLPGQNIRTTSIPIKDLLVDAWQGVKPLADAKEISVQIAGDQSTAQLSVCGDRKQLHRALLNLFDNALVYSPQGAMITVDLSASAEWIRIGIEDQGPGLSEQDLEHMFERFYRGDSSRFRQQRGGSGLGLAIVQQIVLTHGGWVLGVNNRDGGARFEISLPLNANL